MLILREIEEDGEAGEEEKPEQEGEAQDWRVSRWETWI